MMELIKIMAYYFVMLIFQPCFPIVMYQSVKVWNQTDKSYDNIEVSSLFALLPHWKKKKDELDVSKTSVTI